MSRLEYLLSRRRFLSLSAAAGLTLALAACGDDDDDEEPTATTATGAGADPTATEEPAETELTEAEPTATEDLTEAEPTATEEEVEETVLVGDVTDYSLEPDGWDGPFGSVTFTMHRGHIEHQDVYYIRTDSSDSAFADAEGLVFVPLLQNALQAEGSYANLYTFAQSAEDQGAIVTTIPGLEDYTPAFRIHTVMFTIEPELLTSEAALMEAEQAGSVTIEATDVIVNYPLVKWGDEGLPVDAELLEPLGVGPLVSEPDMDAMTCTFKLHQCFPGSRYIVTDTSAVPMAPMMGVVGSGATGALADAGATAPITIFVNGLEGPGVMGFQPAIFNSKAGDPIWSPFWNHFAAEWADPTQATVVRSQEELDALVESGDLILYNGLPDTHPDGFVVNCPAPVLAPNTYEA
jgi:hypothetical protein